MRFDITLEPSAPLFEFLIKRGEKIVLDAATEGLRKRVLGSPTGIGSGLHGPGTDVPSRLLPPEGPRLSYAPVGTVALRPAELMTCRARAYPVRSE